MDDATVIEGNKAVLLAEYSAGAEDGRSGSLLSYEHKKKISEAISASAGQLADFTLTNVGAVFWRMETAVEAATKLRQALLEERMSNIQRSSMSGRFGVAFGDASVIGGRCRGTVVQSLRKALRGLPPNSVGVTSMVLRSMPAGIRDNAKMAMPDPDNEFQLWVVDGGAAEAPVTERADLSATQNVTVFSSISLFSQGREILIKPPNCPWRIGRSEECDLQLHGSLASRDHGWIDYSGGKFRYVDDSANGTYLLTGQGIEVFLHHESSVIADRGVISPGVPLADQKDDVIRFHCRRTTLALSDESGEPGGSSPPTGAEPTAPL